MDREFKKARAIANKSHWRLTSFQEVKLVKGLRYKINNSKNDKERLSPYKDLLKLAKKLKKDLPKIIKKLKNEFEKLKLKSLKKSLDQLINIDFF